MSLMTAFVFLALGGFAIFGILRIHDKTLRSIGTQARSKPLTDEQIRKKYWMNAMKARSPQITSCHLLEPSSGCTT